MHALPIIYTRHLSKATDFKGYQTFHRCRRACLRPFILYCMSAPKLCYSLFSYKPNNSNNLAGPQVSHP